MSKLPANELTAKKFSDRIVKAIKSIKGRGNAASYVPGADPNVFLLTKSEEDKV